METSQIRILIGGAMIALGLVQTGWGITGNEWIYALLGTIFALIGAAYLWVEGLSAVDQPHSDASES